MLLLILVNQNIQYIWVELEQDDEIRYAVKEINNLKKELREIKDLIKEIVK